MSCRDSCIKLRCSLQGDLLSIVQKADMDTVLHSVLQHTVLTASFRSYMVSMISSCVSPNPSMMLDLVYTPHALAALRTSKDWK